MNTQIILLFLSISFLFQGCFNSDEQSENLGCAVVDKRTDTGHSKNPPPSFQMKCATCHMLDKNTTGPALLGIQSREPYTNWTQDFIRNQDSLIEVNDSSTLESMKWSAATFKHNFEEITPKEMRELLDYFSAK